MGAYSPLPWLTERFGGEDEFVAQVTRDIAEPVIRQMDAEGTPFIGLLYAGLILTEQGVKVIEFNARFGDPETQVVLPRLIDPLSRLLLAAASGTLEDQPRPAFAEATAVTVVLASEGYPEAPLTGRVLTGIDEAEEVDGVHVAHAATALRDGDLVATGGRVLSVVATARPSAKRARRPTPGSSASGSRAGSTAPTSPRAWPRADGPDPFRRPAVAPSANRFVLDPAARAASVWAMVDRDATARGREIFDPIAERQCDLPGVDIGRSSAPRGCASARRSSRSSSTAARSS